MQKTVKHILRDLTRDKHRAVLSMLALIIGMAAFGIILFCYNIIVREIPEVYQETQPASASLMVSQVDDELYNIIEDYSGISDFQISGYYNFRVKAGEEWKTLELFADLDYPERVYNKPGLLTGTLSLNANEALIEGDAISIANADVGDSVSVMLDNSEIKEVTLTGSVNDLSVHPATMHNVVYLYVGFETLEEWGLLPNKIEYVVSGEKYDRENILQVSNELIDLLESRGYPVSSLQVEDTPGESMHMEEYQGALFLLQIFSIIALIFGCMIMSNLISGILSNQIRQIGIIKAIGGTYRSIVTAYFLALLLITVVAAAISAAIALLVSGRLAEFLLGIGNMIPDSTKVSGSIQAVFGVTIFLLPLLTAAFPLAKGLRISVKEAVSDYGINNQIISGKGVEISFLSRPVLLSLRNMFRRKGRFLLNVVILTFAGSLFIAVLSNLITVQNAINESVGMLNYDYEMTVTGQVEEERISELADEAEEISAYEVWKEATAWHLYGDGQIGNAYSLISPEDSSAMIEPVMISGRWIEDHEQNQVVVTEGFLENESQYELGDTIEFQINDDVYSFEIGGILNDFNMAKVYINRSQFDEVVGQGNGLQSIKLISSGTGNRRSPYSGIDARFEENGIYIYTSESINDIKNTLKSHYSVTLQTFFIIILLIVAVAGFGLTATVNAQTSERKKEIGVMKAIGAVKKQIIRIITAESIFISLFSCGGAAVLGAIISVVSIPLFGEIINVPLTVSAVPILVSLLLWTLLAFVVGYLSGRKVAKRTAKIPAAKIFAAE